MCWCREFGDQKSLRLPLTDVNTLWFQSVAFTCHALQTLETVKKITSNSPPLRSVSVDPSKASSNPLSSFGPLEMHPLLPLHLICGMHFFFFLDNDLLEDKAHIFFKVVFVVLTSKVSGI